MLYNEHTKMYLYAVKLYQISQKMNHHTQKLEMMNYETYEYLQPVPVAAPSEALSVFDRSNTGIVRSNPTRGIDVCPRFSVLCCPV
jgi:hypothetical protein